MAKTKAKAKKKSAVKAKPKAKAKLKLKSNTKVTKKSAPAKKVKPKAKAVAKPVTLKASVVTKPIDVTKFVTPLDDRMIVQVSSAEKMTAGGLYIPDTVTNISGNREGVVLAVGRGHRDPKGRVRPMDVKKGDKVVFSDFSGSKITYQGQDLIILRETDIMGVLN